MSCEHQDHLIDLVYGELEGARAEALRAEVEACEVCREEFQDLEAAKALADQMPVVEPPTGMRAAILAAAAAKAASAAPAEPEVERERDDTAEPRERVAEVVPLFGGYLPQVLVAAAAALLVVGVWFWPRGEDPRVSVADPSTIERDPETHDITDTPELDPQVDPAPETQTQTDTPADPSLDGTDQDADQDTVVAPNLDEPPTVADARAAPRVARTTQAQTRERGTAPIPGERAQAPTTNRQRPAMRRSGRELLLGMTDESSVTEGGLDTQSAQNAQAQNAQTAREEAAEVEVEGWRLGEGAGSQDSLRPSQARPSRAAQHPTQQASPEPTQPSPNTIEPMGAGDRDDYERAMSRYRRGDYAGAATEFERVVQRPSARELMPSAQHHLARSHRRRGACAQAVNHYERLFRLYPAYAQLPQALLEAADCYRRTGRTREARQLLHRAAGYNSTSDAAQRELRRLDTIDQAQRRSAPSNSQAESLESAY